MISFTLLNAEMNDIQVTEWTCLRRLMLLVRTERLEAGVLHLMAVYLQVTRR
jgi:hypothetical protein